MPENVDPKKTKEANKEAKELTSTFKDYRDILKEINVELGKKTNNIKDASSAYSGLESIANKLKNDEEELTRLSKKEIDSLREKAKLNLQAIKDAADLVKEGGKLTEEEKALLQAKKEGFKIEKEFLEKIEKRLQQEEKINKALGIGGNVLKGSKEAMDKLGLSGLSTLMNFDKANEKMDAMAKKLTDNGNKTAGFGDKIKIVGAGLGELGKGLAKSLVDPTVLAAGLLHGFLEINKAQVEYQRETGTQIDLQDTLNGHLLTSTDYIKAATQLTKDLGVQADLVFKPEDIAEVAEMTDHIGLGAKEAANLAAMSKINGMSVGEQNKLLIDSVNQYKQSNKLATNNKQILNDVANSSKTLQVSLGKNPESLAKAAAAARSLGMSLGEMEGIADSLLDFESSISNELEAELLTGKQLNLEKAREAALNNDLAGMSAEIGKNQEVIQAFTTGNRIQQEAIAKSLGMSKDQVAGMVMQQRMNAGLTEDQMNAQEKATYESMKQAEVTEKFKKSIEKVQQALVPIVGFVADLVSHWYVLYPLLGIIALSYIPKISSGIKGMTDNLKGVGSSLKSLVKGDVKGATGGLLGGDKASEAAGDAANKTKNVKGEQGKEVKGFLKGLGDGLASIGKQMADVLKGALTISIAGVLFGAGMFVVAKILQDVNPKALILFAGALGVFALEAAIIGKFSSQIMQGALAIALLGAALIPAAFAFSLLKGIDTKAIIAMSIAIPLLALAAAGLGFLLPFIAAGALAIAALGAGLLAFSLGAVVAAKITPDISNLLMTIKQLVDPKLLTGIAIAGPSLIVLGSALGIFGVGLVTLSAGLVAFSLGATIAAKLAPDLEPLFNQIEKLGNPSLAKGLVETGGALVSLAGGLTLFGISLAAAGIGSLIGSITGGGSIVGQLERLANIASPLSSAANSIAQLAVGLKQVAEALEEINVEKLEALEDFVTTEAIASSAKSIVGAVTAPIKAIGDMLGGGGGGEDNTMAEIKEILLQIRDKQGTVTLDGTKVGTALGMSSYKTQ